MLAPKLIYLDSSATPTAASPEPCMEAIEPIAIVDSYDGLISALRQRVADLGTGLGAVDALGGIT